LSVVLASTQIGGVAQVKLTHLYRTESSLSKNALISARLDVVRSLRITFAACNVDAGIYVRLSDN